MCVVGHAMQCHSKCLYKCDMDTSIFLIIHIRYYRTTTDLWNHIFNNSLYLKIYDSFDVNILSNTILLQIIAWHINIASFTILTGVTMLLSLGRGLARQLAKPFIRSSQHYPFDTVALIG